MNELGIIFDLDGVIVDSEGLQYASYAEVLKPLGVAITAEEYEREWIAAGRGPEYAVDRYRLPVTADQLRCAKEPVYRAKLRTDATLMPGVEERLPALSREMPIALATNSNAADTAIVLDGFDLRKSFSAVVTREDYRERKPAPDAFVVAAERIGIPPARCVVVEDASKGVQAAVAAGCPCAAIPNDFTRNNDLTGASVVLESMRDLSLDLIRRLVAVGREYSNREGG